MTSANWRRIEKDLHTLATFNSTPGQGLTRLSYTEEYEGAQAYLREEMEKLGMSVRLDAMGNLIGRVEGESVSDLGTNLPGQRATLIKEGSLLPALAVGSHLDSVLGGGIYDGNVGIVCGLELVRMLQENGIHLSSIY